MASVDDAREWLPKRFTNTVIDFDSVLDGSNFTATVRSNFSTGEEARRWVDEFGQLTRTNWRVRSTYPNAARVAFRQDFVCQHADFNKGAGNKVSKKCGCKAKLSVSIKIVTKDTRYKDSFVKVGVCLI